MSSDNKVEHTATNAESTMSHQDIALAILRDFSTKVKEGEMIIGIWENKEKFEQWQNSTGSKSNSIRVVILNSKFFPSLQVANKKSIIIVGLGIGEKLDYSDVVLFHHLAVKRNPKSKTIA